MEEEEKVDGINKLDDYNGITGFEDSENFVVQQDISGILEETKTEREMRSDGLMKVEKGIRKFGTIPMTTIIEYNLKYGVDILSAEVSRDKWEMAKFRMWVEKNYPMLMSREAGKTRFHTLT